MEIHDEMRAHFVFIVNQKDVRINFSTDRANDVEFWNVEVIVNMEVKIKDTIPINLKNPHSLSMGYIIEYVKCWLNPAWF